MSFKVSLLELTAQSTIEAKLVTGLTMNETVSFEHDVDVDGNGVQASTSSITSTLDVAGNRTFSSRVTHAWLHGTFSSRN